MDINVKDFNVRLRTIKLRELFLWLIIATVITLILTAVFPAVDESDDLFFIVFLTVVLLFFIWALRDTTGITRNLNRLGESKTLNEILYVLIINFVFAFLFLCIISAIDIFMGVYDPSWITGFDIDSVDISPGAFFLSAISSIIFAPLMEELMFRGVLFNRLKIRTGIIPAMIISSFLFAVGHDFGGITSAFLFGMCMCVLYQKTDNIFVPMSVHFLNNVFATFIEMTQIDIIASQMPWLMITTVLTLIATVLVVKYIVNETALLKKRFY